MTDEYKIDGDIFPLDDKENIDETLIQEFEVLKQEKALEFFKMIDTFLEKSHNIILSKEELVIENDERLRKKYKLLIKVLYAMALEGACDEILKTFKLKPKTELHLHIQALKIINIDYPEETILQIIDKIHNFNPDKEEQRAFRRDDKYIDWMIKLTFEKGFK